MLFRDQGTALVTGASSGIGAPHAERLARRGYDATLVARSRRRFDTLVGRMSEETGRAVEVVAADLSKKEDLARIERLLKQDAGLTMFLNDAGVGATAPLLQSNVHKMKEMITLNVGALVRLVYAAGRDRAVNYGYQGAHHAPPPHVLAIDNDAAIRQLITDYLGDSKLRVTVFRHSVDIIDHDRHIICTMTCVM